MENAFKTVLDYSDDIYLLRLMMQNEDYLHKLTKQTALRVTSRFLKIHHSQFINVLCLDFLTNPQKNNLIPCGNLKKINDIVG